MSASEMSVSRRGFISGGSVWIAALSTGGVTLAWPSPAKATVASAAGMIQAGLSLYQLSRSGGGGIGSLLAAQTEMLRALSQQMNVVNEKLDEIYGQIAELRTMLRSLPDRVAGATFRGQVLGSIANGSSLLLTIDEKQRSRGRLAAIQAYDSSATAILTQMRQPVYAIMRETSTANLPLIALAWYTDFQLMTQGCQLDLARIRQVASDYSMTFNRWLNSEDGINAELAAIDREARRLLNLNIQAELFNNLTCYSAVQASERPVPYTIEYTASAQRNVLTRTAEISSVEAIAFQREIRTLQGLGESISPSLLELTAPMWALAETPDRFQGHGTDARSRYLAARQRHRDQHCGFPLNPPGPAIEEWNRRVQLIANLRLRALVHHHLALVGKEAKRSTDAVMARLA